MPYNDAVEDVPRLRADEGSVLEGDEDVSSSDDDTTASEPVVADERGHTLLINAVMNPYQNELITVL